MKNTNGLIVAVALGFGALIVIPLMLLKGGPFDVQSAGLQSFWDGIWNLISNGFGLDVPSNYSGPVISSTDAMAANGIANAGGGANMVPGLGFGAGYVGTLGDDSTGS
ncbi:MAG TPA: hypothetical protein VMU24_02305 [Candidatus Acidoferrales bacterium]|nr:hypothetical protein [Candidatus Acidoferrales bacterium]